MPPDDALGKLPACEKKLDESLMLNPIGAVFYDNAGRRRLRGSGVYDGNTRPLSTQPDAMLTAMSSSYSILIVAAKLLPH